MYDALKVYLYLAPIMLVFMISEYTRGPKTYDLQDSVTNFRLLSLTVLLKSVTKILELTVYEIFFLKLMSWRESHLGYAELGNKWWVYMLGFLLIDLVYYWFHRLGHEVRFFWANHIIHHSSPYYNFTTAIRLACWTHFFKFIFWAPLAMLGFHPLFIIYALVLIDIYQYFLHTQKAFNLGWLEKIFNTPNLHEVHHAKNPEYIDKNYAAVLIIWDRIFGTYQPLDPNLPPEFGVSTPPRENTVQEVITHEFVQIWKDLKKASGLKEKWMTVFASPAWSVKRFSNYTAAGGISSKVPSS
ncbi:MAG: sterol desaturase family protein [Saprospiraceae bacterium]|nr:sterol desaturase family protein [Lewinella sp.]